MSNAVWQETFKVYIQLLQLDGSSRLLVKGVQGAKFVAEDEKYLVYSSHGSTANPLIVRDKRSGSTVASVRLRHDIQ
jgi:hypothetical protein